MKVKDLIKLLKEVDQECHIRINGMMPIDIEQKPGYWDGPYEYMEDDKLIFSTHGDKVDIQTLDVEDWVWENFSDWEDKIEFRYTYSDNSKEREVREHLSRVAKEAAEYDKHSIEEFSKFVADKIKDGWKVVQNDTEVGRYNTMFFTKPLHRKIQLRQGDCHAIIRGSFKPKVKKDCIEWELKKEYDQ